MSDDKIRSLATWYRKQMIQAKRTDEGAAFWRFKNDDKPTEDRCRALAFAAHNDGDIMPDDWRYQFMWEVLSAIEDASDLDEIEIEADIYTAELTDWLGSRNDRSGYCDEAQREGILSESASMSDRMSIGQYMEKREVLEAVLAHLREEAETSEDEEQEASA